MQSNKKHKRIAALGIALALGMTACSSGGTTSTGSSSGGSPPSTTAAASAPGASATPAAATGQNYVGKVDGTKSLLAIQVDGSKAYAYYCDSAKQWGTLDGTVSGANITATSGADTLKGTVSGDTITGTITIDGTSYNFTAQKATGQAGVFVQDVKDGDSNTTTAWIRDNSGTVQGASFAVNTAKLAGLSSVISAGKKFTPAELQTINQIVDSGVAPSVPPSNTVPAGAVPFSFGSAVRCGFAGFKFKRAQQALNANDNQANQDAFFDSLGNLNSACGIHLGT